MFVALCLCVVSVFSVINRASGFEISSGALNKDTRLSVKENIDNTKKINAKTKSVNENTSAKKDSTQAIADSTEPRYAVKEVDISDGNIDYENFSVNNSTDYSLDINELLNDDLGFEMEDSRKVQVLIVHTHTCESYMNEDVGSYPQSFYPRTTDNSKNVYSVGERIEKQLKENGIGVVHADVQHDSPSYDGAYQRSYETISRYLEKYKGIKVVLDIHRDSMTQQDNTKLKPTFEYDGKKAAQIMIMAGYDASGENFVTWKDNLRFALRLQSKCESMYPGMTRPLNFGNFTYNMNVNSGSLLIEVGTDANTHEEALNSGEMIGNALSEVLQNA